MNEAKKPTAQQLIDMNTAIEILALGPMTWCWWKEEPAVAQAILEGNEKK